MQQCHFDTVTAADSEYVFGFVLGNYYNVILYFKFVKYRKSLTTNRKTSILHLIWKPVIDHRHVH